MKAVIVESKKGHAVALKEDGTFIQLSNGSYKEGDVIHMKDKKSFSTWKRALVTAAAMFIVFFGVGITAYMTPAYTVSMDVNPAIVYQVNRFEQVIGYEGENGDGEAVLSQLNLRNRSIEDALAMTVDQIEEMGYFKENRMVYVATAAKNENKGEEMSAKLQQSVQAHVDGEGIQAEVRSGLLGYEMVQEAKKQGLTPGKLNLIVNLVGIDVEDEDFDGYKTMSVKTLMEMKQNGNSGNAPGQDPEKEIGKPEETPGNGPNEDAAGDQTQSQDQIMDQIMDQTMDQEKIQEQSMDQDGTNEEYQNQYNNPDVDPNGLQNGIDPS